MQVIATFADGKTVDVLVDPWAVDAATETFFEMGALMVSTRTELSTDS